VPFGNDDFDRRKVIAIDAMRLYNSAQRVFEDFEEDVVL
jgi:hypothetical protein